MHFPKRILSRFLVSANVSETQSVKYKDSDGTETTMTVTTDYLWETNEDQIGRIVLPYEKSWPTDTLYPSKPITIKFVCGWTSAAGFCWSQYRRHGTGADKI